MSLARHAAAGYGFAMVEPSELEARLREAFPDASVIEVEDLTGSKDHYQATIVSASFEGQSPVQRHKAVYKALEDWMRGPIHALALNTHTPEGYRKPLR